MEHALNKCRKVESMNPMNEIHSFTNSVCVHSCKMWTVGHAEVVAMKPCIKKGFVGVFLIWVLFLGAKYVFPTHNKNRLGYDWSQAIQDNSTEMQKRLDLALQQFKELKRNNAEMKRILGNANPDAANKPGVLSLVGDNETMSGKGDPTYEYEKMRRHLELDMKELWYSIRGHASGIGRKDFEQIQEIYRLLRSYPLKLRKEDGYEIYREREMKELSRIVQKRIHDLQNPPDCASAKKVVCSIHGECGFGCQIHYLVYCMKEAHATGRMLILESKGWKYHWEGWEKVFLPVSDNCTSSSGSANADWGCELANHGRITGDHDAQVLALPLTNFAKAAPDLPMTIPSDIASRLEKVHGEPQSWWVGQFVTYLLRFQPKMQALLDEVKVDMDIITPTVGVHIRRTDKVFGSEAEASFHSLKEYMDHVEEYFTIRENFEGSEKRRVFIASDDPSVIDEAGKTYTGTEWQIMSDKSVAQSASVDKRYRVGLFGIIKDIFLLSECDYVVCTFSSNVCRLAYEIMQTKHADASGRFFSLDWTYYFHDRSKTIQIAKFPHKPRSDGELELAVGDKIEEFRHLWNESSKGTNRRNNKTGLYPSYKTRN